MSISGRPFFSIVIPTYNRASLLEKTLQSIQPQTYPHFEVLVIDDGGTDSSREVVRAMEDPRILYYYKANEERGAAR
ncbi:MAG: glycosyltransferase family 2 protein, partial [Bacteroidetes bacterium]|nr:glycosyltransferase family 2 protein [Bacteroidota bacterium]